MIGWGGGGSGNVEEGVDGIDVYDSNDFTASGFDQYGAVWAVRSTFRSMMRIYNWDGHGTATKKGDRIKTSI
jgi:hypothetical protein